MYDVCVCCGRELPTECGSLICKQCENEANSDSIVCPSCKSKLEVMTAHWWNTDTGICKSTIFHCDYCGDDWEKEEEYVAKPVVFKRKYWG